MGAITWVKAHNQFYVNIKLNDEWTDLSYEDPLILLADGDKTHGSGTDNVCDLNMSATRSGFPLEDSVHPSETLYVNSHGGEKQLLQA